jgi:uncharacterized membrane protein YbaN (DUF454 family)
MSRKELRRWLLMTIGVLAVGLGIAGIFLPLLPTTPFLLLAAACFIRSSDRLYQWLIQNKWFGSYIRNYQEYRALPLRAKVVALILLWTTMSYTVFVLVNHLALRVFLLLVAVIVTVYLLRLKTIKEEKRKAETSVASQK